MQHFFFKIVFPLSVLFMSLLFSDTFANKGRRKSKLPRTPPMQFKRSKVRQNPAKSALASSLDRFKNTVFKNQRSPIREHPLRIENKQLFIPRPRPVRTFNNNNLFRALLIPAIPAFIGLGTGLAFLLSQQTGASVGISEIGSPKTNITIAVTNNNSPTIRQTMTVTNSAVNTNSDADTIVQTNTVVVTNTNNSGRKRRKRRVIEER
eukprot:UN26593